MSTPDTSPQFFDRMFGKTDDPWNFAGDTYEQFRYRTIMGALGPGPFRHAWEPGCSVGVLTEQLAEVCTRVDACDFAPAAVRQAATRCSHLPGVLVRCAALDEPVTYANFDLIVLSEIGYYFSSAAWRGVVENIVGGMQPGATLLASHWLGSSTDHRLDGDEVHSLMHHAQLFHRYGNRYPEAGRGGFRLDRWERLP